MRTFAARLCVFLLLVSAVPASAIQYRLIPLGHLGDGSLPWTSGAHGLNAAGQVVGISETRPGPTEVVWQAFQWDPLLGMSALPDLDGGLFESWAYDVNDAGQAVGFCYSPAGHEACVWAAGVPASMGTLGHGYPGSQAYAINNLGQAVGEMRSVSQSEAFLWNGSVTLLGDLPGGAFNSIAYDVNDAGQVVGLGASALGNEGFLWQNGVMTPLGDLPGGPFSSGASAINNLGQIVGWSSSANGTEAVLWDGANLTPLGDLPGGSYSSVATGINDHGQVVGYSNASGGQSAAFVWDRYHGMQRLGSLVDASGANWLLTNVTAINDAGQIAGHGYNPQMVHEAFLLEPVGPTDADGDGFAYYAECDDANADRFPGNPEVVRDGVDQDCNGYDLTIVVTSAAWSRAKKTLSVTASSLRYETAALVLEGYGPMSYHTKKKTWSLVVTNVYANPGTVTVSGVEGAVQAETGK